jgi:hypothetical protein
MLKILKLILLSIVGTVLFLVGYRYVDNPERIIPYPYVMGQMSFSDTEEAENADVLIIGDRMGVALEPILERLTAQTSKGLRTPLKIYNWSWTHEGLHRSIARLKTLKKFPPVIIYQGGSEEFFERKLYLEDRDVIFSNFAIYDNPSTLSLIITFPILSRFLYRKGNLVTITQKTPNKTLYSPLNKQTLMELHYKIYEYELRELIRLTKDNKSKLILMTTPINFDVEPKEVCENAQDQEVIESLQLLQNMIENGQTKQAYADLKVLSKELVANARAYYLLGQAAKAQADFPAAREALKMAAVFDCAAWRGGPIFNAIMFKEAKEQKVRLMDFDRLVNQHYGRNELFIDDLYPQFLYYEHLTESLAETLRDTLNL